MQNNEKTHQLLQKITAQEQQELTQIKEQFISKAMQIMDETNTDNTTIIKDILSEIYPETDDLDEIYAQLSDLKQCLDSFRPFNNAQMANLKEVFDTQYTYESNRIEGNSLTLRETDLVINKGLTINGKPLRDHFEAVNHLEAINYVREVVDNKLMFNEKVLLDIHSLILQGIDRLNAGSYRRDNVRISGSSHICPNFRKVPTHMEEYFQWYENIKETLHPVDLASQAHQKLVSIHPFIDGNGRTARLIMNLILLQNGYPITVIASDRKKRDKYYDSLESSHSSQINEKNQFQLLVAEYVKKWVFEYLHLIAPSGNGESKSKGYYFFKKIAPYIDKQ